MDHRDMILRQINDLIGSLRQPLTEEARQHGWTEAAQVGMTGFLESLRQKVASELQLPPDEMKPMLVRGMDMWGVTSGDLLMKGASVDRLFREWLPGRA
jgi:hypothetical protein